MRIATAHLNRYNTNFYEAYALATQATLLFAHAAGLISPLLSTTLALFSFIFWCSLKLLLKIKEGHKPSTINRLLGALFFSLQTLLQASTLFMYTSQLLIAKQILSHHLSFSISTYTRTLHTAFRSGAVVMLTQSFWSFCFKNIKNFFRNIDTAFFLLPIQAALISLILLQPHLMPLAHISVTALATLIIFKRVYYIFDAKTPQEQCCTIAALFFLSLTMITGLSIDTVSSLLGTHSELLSTLCSQTLLRIPLLTASLFFTKLAEWFSFCDRPNVFDTHFTFFSLMMSVTCSYCVLQGSTWLLQPIPGLGITLLLAWTTLEHLQRTHCNLRKKTAYQRLSNSLFNIISLTHCIAASCLFVFFQLGQFPHIAAQILTYNNYVTQYCTLVLQSPLCYILLALDKTITHPYVEQALQKTVRVSKYVVSTIFSASFASLVILSRFATFLATKIFYPTLKYHPLASSFHLGISIVGFCATLVDYARMKHLARWKTTFFTLPTLISWLLHMASCTFMISPELTQSTLACLPWITEKLHSFYLYSPTYFVFVCTLLPQCSQKLKSTMCDTGAINCASDTYTKKSVMSATVNANEGLAAVQPA